MQTTSINQVPPTPIEFIQTIEVSMPSGKRQHYVTAQQICEILISFGYPLMQDPVYYCTKDNTKHPGRWVNYALERLVISPGINLNIKSQLNINRIFKILVDNHIISTRPSKPFKLYSLKNTMELLGICTGKVPFEQYIHIRVLQIFSHTEISWVKSKPTLLDNMKESKKTFIQYGAQTGRFNCEEPNMSEEPKQNKELDAIYTDTSILSEDIAENVSKGDTEFNENNYNDLSLFDPAEAVLPSMLSFMERPARLLTKIINAFKEF